MAPMWHPTSAVTRTFREHVPLAPQLVHQDWLTACRSSAPHSSADTGTLHRRSVVSSSVPAGQTVPCTLVCCYSKGLSPYSFVLAVIPLPLSRSLCCCCCGLPAVRFLAVRHTARCSSWRLATSAVSLFLLAPRCSQRIRWSHSWTVPLSLFVFSRLSGTARLSHLSVFFFPGCSA